MRAKSLDAGQSPTSLGSAIDLADDASEWFDNYVFADPKGQAWMFLEVQ